jgi:D-glycerate 3-kinase
LRVLGINGAQGSGKSTLAAFLVQHLAEHHGLRALAISLDDFYLSRAERAQLAATVHPLLITRGVPGTHDVQRGIACLRALPHLQPGEVCALPRFSKATDDALDSAHDRRITEAPDIVLFEGWCVGTPPQDAVALATPINALERDEDPTGTWRQCVNTQLAGPYAEWFALLDALVFLQVPGWAQVQEWRAQQERETAARHQGPSALLDDAQLQRFMQHYQRLTQHALDTLPGIAQASLQLDLAHGVSYCAVGRSSLNPSR